MVLEEIVLPWVEEVASSDHQGVVVGEVVVQKFVLAVEAFQALHAFQGNQEVASFHVVAYLQVPEGKKSLHHFNLVKCTCTA